MNVLNIRDLHKSYGGRPIFEGASLAIDEAEKVGFIGVNGSGKSTLFRIVAGLEGADAGEIALRRGVQVGYLAQEPELVPGRTIRETVAEGRSDLVAAAAEYDALSRRLAAPHADHERLVGRHSDLAATLDRLGGWDWMHRVEAMLQRLGVGAVDRTVDALSGGEAKRVALARTLLAQPGLLLLDEPTNHLDADTVLYLEEYLIDYAGAVMLITHDRYFLDRVVDRMIEVAPVELASFDGGYTEYLEAQAARTERLATHEARRRRLLERELEWARRAPPARTGKARGRLKRAEALATEADAYRARQVRQFSIEAPAAPRLGRTVLNLHGIGKSWSGHSLIRDLDATLRGGERIGIIGPNGAGKTTLLRIILGETDPDTGRVEFGVNTRLAYFDQSRTQLDGDVSVYEALGGTDWVTPNGRRTHVRSYLEDFLFPTARQQQKVSSLSGGERNRLMLAKLFLEPANLLLLDEPTNDLDLVTLQVLEDALESYAGCVLMVTHDRYFLDKVATGLLVFEGDGVVHRHEGGFELYRRLRDERLAAARDERPDRRDERPATRPAREREARDGKAAAADAATITAASDAPRKLTWKEARELEALEDRITEAESRRDKLGQQLAAPELYRDAADAAATVAAWEQAKAEVDALYARWAELSERAG
jgi:ABC transport system ATP-binding/permease protein